MDNIPLQYLPMEEYASVFRKRNDCADQLARKDGFVIFADEFDKLDEQSKAILMNERQKRLESNPYNGKL